MRGKDDEIKCVARSLIPKPLQSEYSEGWFNLNAATAIVVCSEFKGKGHQLAEMLFPATGWDLNVTFSRIASNFISLERTADFPDESYQLEIKSHGVVVKAGTQAGIFYGTQSLMQLLPTKIYSQKRQPNISWRLPCVTIIDKPTYTWRGMMLDVSRYFLNKDFVLRYLDIMAMHKMNALHLHVVDDCGWRIEIKKYPKLTTVGAFRGQGVERNGGYYTQEEIKEIVQYAADRNITIIPEIELPAHTLSAIAAYPELSCTGEQHEVPDYHFISNDLYCAGQESTWQFLENVFDEVLDLFPGENIHIGGDEAKYDRWEQCPHCQAKMKELGLEHEKELQGWMTTLVEQILAKHGRRIIGWDEILQCNVSTKAGLMPWQNPDAAVQGAKRGNPVVMAPTAHCYFDTPESQLPGELPGATWIPPVTMSHAYNWEPRPNELTNEQAENILGANGCLWTDQLLQKKELRNIETLNERRAERYVEYFSLPRMAALAEVLWTPKASRNFGDFSKRMGRQYNRYEAAGFHYRLPVPNVIPTKTARGVSMEASTAVEGGVIRYTVDGTYPHLYSPIYTEPVLVKTEQDFKAIVVAPGGKHCSLTSEFQLLDQQYAIYGDQIGEWKSGEHPIGIPMVFEFDATGKVNKKGHYTVTFICTKGRRRLNIDYVMVYENREEVAKDVHRGFAGESSKYNTYKFMIPYETGASYIIKAAINGDKGNDSHGLVFIKEE